MKKTGPIRKQAAPREERGGTEPMYFAFVVWGAVATSVLYFLGYGYLTFFDREFGIEMEDFSYYEVLLKAYNVIKILDPKFLALMVLALSGLYSVALVYRRGDGLVKKGLRRVGPWALVLLLPLLSLAAAGGVWVFFRAAFEMSRESGVIYAGFVKTHLSEQSRVRFVLDASAEKNIPPFLLDSNAKGEFRLVARTKQSYYVMRLPAEGKDGSVYEFPRAKVLLVVLEK